MFNIKTSKTFSKKLNKLPLNIQVRAKEIVRRLETEELGSRLKGNLRDYYSIHFENNRYRTIYHKDADILEILVVTVGKRTETFYADVTRIV